MQILGALTLNIVKQKRQVVSNFINVDTGYGVTVNFNTIDI